MAEEDDILALAVAKSEAERILYLLPRALKKTGPRAEADRFTRIEEAARRIVATVNNTNKRHQPVPQVQSGVGLRIEDSDELRTDEGLGSS